MPSLNSWYAHGTHHNQPYNISSFNIQDNPIKAAETRDETRLRHGNTFSSCCGSQIVSDVTIDARNQGITMSLNDKQLFPDFVPDDSVFESVKVGDTWFNFKLRV